MFLMCADWSDWSGLTTTKTIRAELSGAETETSDSDDDQ